MREKPEILGVVDHYKTAPNTQYSDVKMEIDVAILEVLIDIRDTLMNIRASIQHK